MQRTYFVAEPSVKPEHAVGFTSLKSARKYAMKYFGGKRDTTLKGKRHYNGTRHVEAYYDDEYRSGCWITVRGDKTGK